MKHMVKNNHLVLPRAPLSFFQCVMAQIQQENQGQARGQQPKLLLWYYYACDMIPLASYYTETGKNYFHFKELYTLVTTSLCFHSVM